VYSCANPVYGYSVEDVVSIPQISDSGDAGNLVTESCLGQLPTDAETQVAHGLIFSLGYFASYPSPEHGIQSRPRAHLSSRQSPG